MSLGVSIGATTFQNALALHLSWNDLPSEIATHAEGYIPTLHSLPSSSMRDSIFNAYRFGIQIVFSVSLALSVITLVLTVVFLKNVDMNRKLDTEHELESGKSAIKDWTRKGQASGI
jgi:hypothetical protein